MSKPKSSFWLDAPTLRGSDGVSASPATGVGVSPSGPAAGLPSVVPGVYVEPASVDGVARVEIGSSENVVNVPHGGGALVRGGKVGVQLDSEGKPVGMLAGHSAPAGGLGGVVDFLGATGAEIKAAHDEAEKIGLDLSETKKQLEDVGKRLETDLASMGKRVDAAVQAASAGAGGIQVYRSPEPPGPAMFPDKRDGAVCWHTLAGRIFGQYRWDARAGQWVEERVTSDVIANLTTDKLVAGGALIRGDLIAGGAIGAKHITATEELEAKLASVRKVTTDQLVAGNAQITNELLVDTLRGKHLVGVDIEGGKMTVPSLGAPTVLASTNFHVASGGDQVKREVMLSALSKAATSVTVGKLTNSTNNSGGPGGGGYELVRVTEVFDSNDKDHAQHLKDPTYAPALWLGLPGRTTIEAFRVTFKVRTRTGMVLTFAGYESREKLLPVPPAPDLNPEWEWNAREFPAGDSWQEASITIRPKGGRPAEIGIALFALFGGDIQSATLVGEYELADFKIEALATSALAMELGHDKDGNAQFAITNKREDDLFSRTPVSLKATTDPANPLNVSPTLTMVRSDYTKGQYSAVFIAPDSVTCAGAEGFSNASWSQILAAATRPAQATQKDSTPVGTIVAFAGATAPDGWLMCDGAGYEKTKYPELAKVLAGNSEFERGGSQNFYVPELRGRVPVGKGGAASGAIGSRGGEAAHRLTVAEMPSHTHPVGGGWGDGPRNLGKFKAHENSPATDWSPVGATGGNQPHNNMQPYTVVNYIIKAR